MIYSGDKQFFTNENKTAFLMYRYKASSLVVLGDPLGDENAFDELLEAF
ncbi:phosphatidylglycerol lysyltransferase domain-containing protein [Staphylococcus aureus]|nr:phosphatidylglycerol lysyltransferase domain-containing protein [Staphylococcus aureus]